MEPLQKKKKKSQMLCIPTEKFSQPEHNITRMLPHSTHTPKPRCIFDLAFF